MITFTPAQRLAMETTGCNLLVTASAGTGKTSTLVERCIHLLTRAEQPLDLRQLLVVTFTDAAAREMRTRVGERLRDLAEAQPQELRWREQLALLPKAQISTIHAFCLNLLRENFLQLNLDPGFRVFDQDEVVLLRQEVLEEVFEEYYCREDEEGQAFFDLVTAYGGNDKDDRLRALVDDLAGFLDTQVEPQAWCQAATEAYAAALRATQWSDIAWAPFLARQAQADFTRLYPALRRARQKAAAEQLPFLAGLADQQLEILAKAVEEFRQLHFECAGELLHDLPRANLTKARGASEEVKQAFSELRDELDGEVEKYLTLNFEAAVRGIQAVQPQVRVLFELVNTFRARMQAEKKQRNGVDFDDQQRFALDLLVQPRAEGAPLAPSALARELRRRYAEVLVDEYQDINPLQEAVLQLVSRQNEPQLRPNLFMVGDSKQSIYRFRLAEPDLFVRKQSRYSRAVGAEDLRVDLRENFRNRREIINFANFLFGQLFQADLGGMAYGEAERLEYHAGYPDGDTPLDSSRVEVHILDHPRRQKRAEAETEAAEPVDKTTREAVWVGQRIQQLVCAGFVVPPSGGPPDQANAGFVVPPLGGLPEHPDGPLMICERGGETLRPVEYKDIVILFRTAAGRVEEYVRVLRGMGIPVRAEAKAGFLEAQEIRDMLALLTLIDNVRQDIPLAAVLRSPVVGLAEAELTRIRVAAHGVDFFTAVKGYADRQSDALAQRLQVFLARLERWRTQARREPLSNLVASIIAETGYADYVCGLYDGAQRRANLARLHDRSLQFDSFSRQGLFRFLHFIEEMGAEERDLGAAPAPAADEQVVRIMTIHKSKGLEFPVVFLPDLSHGFKLTYRREQVNWDRHLFLGLEGVDLPSNRRYPTLSSLVVNQAARQAEIAEELRILYVAVTRAREKLILSALAPVKESGEEWRQWSGESPDQPLPIGNVLSASCFLDWLGPCLSKVMNVAQPPRLGDEKAAEAQPGAAMPHTGLFTAQAYDAEAVAKLVPPEQQQRPDTSWRSIVADLSPLPAELGTNPEAEHTVARLNWKYPHPSVMGLRSKLTVSDLKRHLNMLQEEDQIPAYPETLMILEPKFVTGERKQLTATEVGSAVHVALQHVDFGGDLSEAGLRQQLQSMVQRELLTVAQTEAVRMRWLLDFFASPHGQRIISQRQRLLRELPFTLPMRAADVYRQTVGEAAAERVLVQGIIDCLVEEEDGYLLLDYKTDSVPAAQVEERAQRYHIQIGCYRRAVEAIFHRPVKEAVLYFLPLSRAVVMPRQDSSLRGVPLRSE